MNANKNTKKKKKHLFWVVVLLDLEVEFATGGEVVGLLQVALQPVVLHCLRCLCVIRHPLLYIIIHYDTYSSINIY